MARSPEFLQNSRLEPRETHEGLQEREKRKEIEKKRWRERRKERGEEREKW